MATAHSVSWRECNLFPTQMQKPLKRSIYWYIVPTEQHCSVGDVSTPSKVPFIPSRCDVSATARVRRNPTRHWGRLICFSLGGIFTVSQDDAEPSLPAPTVALLRVTQHPSYVFILHAVTCRYQPWKHRSPSTSKQIPVRRLLAVYKSTSGL